MRHLRKTSLSSLAVACALALGLAAGRARAQGEPDLAGLEKACKDGFAAAARAVFLVAAEKGPQAPSELAGGWLPPELEKATPAVAASLRTARPRWLIEFFSAALSSE